jgi:hypothetical protein
MLASTSTNDAIYSYKSASGVTSWTGDGDIFNNGGANFVSPGVMLTTASSIDPYSSWTQAW